MRWPFMLRSTHEQVVQEYIKVLDRAADRNDRILERLERSAALVAAQKQKHDDVPYALP